MGLTNKDYTIGEATKLIGQLCGDRAEAVRNHRYQMIKYVSTYDALGEKDFSVLTIKQCLEAFERPFEGLAPRLL
jgi:hypothetical protein